MTISILEFERQLKEQEYNAKNNLENMVIDHQIIQIRCLTDASIVNSSLLVHRSHVAKTVFIKNHVESVSECVRFLALVYVMIVFDQMYIFVHSARNI